MVTRVRFGADVKKGVSCKVVKSYADVLKNNANSVRSESRAVLNNVKEQQFLETIQ